MQECPNLVEINMFFQIRKKESIWKNTVADLCHFSSSYVLKRQRGSLLLPVTSVFLFSKLSSLQQHASRSFFHPIDGML